MRQIMTILQQYRNTQLASGGARPERLREAADMFSALDASLTGVRLNQSGGWDAPETKLAEMMTSADFSYALGEFVQRRMIPGYTRKRFNFEPLVFNETTPNYMTVTRYQNQQGVNDLEYTPPTAPAKAGNMADGAKRQFRVYKWQKQFDFAMEALVNDDLGYFQSMAMSMGEAARRTLEKYVSRMYTNATSIARLTGLGVNYSGTGRLTSTRISTARMAFAQRTDAAGEPITASLRYLVHPSALIDTVATIQRSQMVPELATNAMNVVAGTFQPIEDPYMTAPTGAPNWPWYAFSDPGTSGIRPFVLVRRQGMPAPLLVRKRSDMESFTGFTVNGQPLPPQMGDFANGAVVVKVWDEWGTYIDDTEGNFFDYRGAYYSSGVTP